MGIKQFLVLNYVSKYIIEKNNIAQSKQPTREYLRGLLTIFRIRKIKRIKLVLQLDDLFFELSLVFLFFT